jgi:uncharacterized membrane protein
MLRFLGRLLMVAGAGVGMAVALAMFAHVGLYGAPWLVNVLLAKLSLVGAGALLAGGAVCERLARRHEERTLLAAPRTGSLNGKS